VAHVGWLVAAIAAALLWCGGGPDVPTGPPTSIYLRWGDKGAESRPTLIEPDHDEDGVLNARDRCPDLPEDIDGYQDDDGCPDPSAKDGHTRAPAPKLGNPRRLR